MTTRQDIDDDDRAWLKRPATSGGIRVADTLHEIKDFAYKTFDQIDEDRNGFISRTELQNALIKPDLDWRERSYISFLLRRLEDIASAFKEEWESKDDGISKVDIQEYFKQFKSV